MNIAPLPWRPEIWLRMRRHFLLKTVGITAWTWLFFIAYFQLLRHPASALTVMPLTAVDRWVPFQPQWLWIYLSLWFYVGIAPALKRHFAELIVYGFWVGGLCLGGLAIFYLWPTQIPPNLSGDSTFPGFGLLKGIDASGNACPSMHVAIAIFTALHLENTLRRCRVPVGWRVLNFAWFAAITISTVTVKQHVSLDVLAGAVLGGVFAWGSLRWPGRDILVTDWWRSVRRRTEAPDIIRRH